MNAFLPSIGLMAKIIVILFIIIALAIIVISYWHFKDDDPDMFLIDDYSDNPGYYGNTHPVTPPDCKHKNKTDVVVWVTTVCEQVHTICDDCETVLNIRTDC